MKVIEITAIWCPSCLVMRPIYEKIYEKYNLDVTKLDYDTDDIKEYNKVEIYRQKITYLESITNNEHIIKDNKKLISDLSVELSKEYENKKENNRVNKKLEEELLNKIAK